MKRILFITLMTMFVASMCYAQDKCCDKKKKSGKCNEKECCCKKEKADTPKAISFNYRKSRNMMSYRIDDSVSAPIDEVYLNKTDEGNKLDLNRDRKTTTIFVEDSVMSRVGELITRYSMPENCDSFDDSEVFLTDVSGWHCSGKLDNGIKFNCSPPASYIVKDEKKMERYTTFSSGAIAIFEYLKTLDPDNKEE